MVWVVVNELGAFWVEGERVCLEKHGATRFPSFLEADEQAARLGWGAWVPVQVLYRHPRFLG